MLEGIVSTLKSSTRSDQFCAQLTAPLKGFELTVDPNGPIAFPISKEAARSLIRYARPAEYGHRERTIYDPKVRHVWEIPRDRIQIEQPAWSQLLDPILKKVQRKLALPTDGKLIAELHNLLIYEAGQFFLGHQDSEKAQGMIGTLVVLLPSEFTGGDLVVDQHGDRKVFRTPAPGTDHLTFIAFYSDCHHEVKPVTDGYRVALTYNLIFEAPSEPLVSRENPVLTDELKKYFSSDRPRDDQSYQREHPRWLIYLLDHEYSQHSLNWHCLKGADRLRAQELLGAAEAIGLTAHLSLAELHETWATEWEPSSRYGRYRQDDDRGADDHPPLTDLVNDECVLRHWISREGKSKELAGHFVPREMLCWTKAADEYEPFRSEYEGYTGNAGNTLDRWYHRAAIVLWKSSADISSLFAIDSRAALLEIQKTLSEDRETGRKALRQILPQWETPSRGDDEAASVIMFMAAAADDPELASRLLAPLGMNAVSLKSAHAMAALMDAYGEAWFVERLEGWRKGQRRAYYGTGKIKDLLPLVEAFHGPYKSVAKWMIEHQLSEVLQQDKPGFREASAKEIKADIASRLETIGQLLKSARAAKEFAAYDTGIQHLIKNPRLYPAHYLVALILELLSEDSLEVRETKVTRELLDDVRSRLEHEVSVEQEKGDWSIRDRVPCQCEDCDELRKFLGDTRLQELVWPLAKDRRQHIHQIIDGMEIPVTHATRRTGSPHKLVLTKTDDLFEQRRKGAKAAAQSVEALRKRSQEPL